MTTSKRKIVFLTGTRADFGKIKSLLAVLLKDDRFEVFLFVTGMHLMHEYGYTLIEIERCGYPNIHTFENHTHETTMELTLAKTITGFSEYIKTVNPDLIVVHGDRVEALAGAITGSLNNYLVAHIEGGEISGTVDELIRHAVTKMSHLHFVANEAAKRRLLQLGELEETIEIIGSPDIDVMFSSELPALEEVKTYYNIPFDDYAVCMFHPVTTEVATLAVQVENLCKALEDSHKNYVVIYPNNDLGSSIIIKAYTALKTKSRFCIYPSLRFEYFLVLLQHASFIIGNSSAGVREAPYYGIPTINVGSRQENRVASQEICNVSYDYNAILHAITHIAKKVSTVDFGKGDSAQQFYKVLQSEHIFNINHQKQFRDL
ncbi:UDP-N-acetylglucosamine 2-epimerase [Zhouia sp. PK063]|uniref:UDP-N-acetylglucosamine 2-epimerase n=1 Tax=Zhouia sp. PK063 TaxID=3373602 RepID=UPI0037A4FC14